MGTSGTLLQCVIVDRLGASFIKPDLLDNNIPFDNTAPIYLISLPWKLGLDLKLHYFSIFHREQRKRAPYLPRISRKVTSC